MTTDTIQQQLQTLSENLGLKYEEQDWGIVNADGPRLNEFVTFYLDSPIGEKMRYQVFELILASANDALDRDIECKDTVTTLMEFLEVHKDDFPEQVCYWAGLPDNDEFPIARFIRQLK